MTDYVVDDQRTQPVRLVRGDTLTVNGSIDIDGSNFSNPYTPAITVVTAINFSITNYGGINHHNWPAPLISLVQGSPVPISGVISNIAQASASKSAYMGGDDAVVSIDASTLIPGNLTINNSGPGGNQVVALMSSNNASVIDLLNFSGVLKLNNTGLIEARSSDPALILGGAGQISNGSSGIVHGLYAGIDIDNASSPGVFSSYVTNDGVISRTDYDNIQMQPGLHYSIRMNSAAGSTNLVDNAGTIGGFDGVAILFGAGDDTLKIRGGSIAGTTDGGGGLDTLDYSGLTSSGAVVDLSTGAATDTGGVSGFERVVGSAQKDVITAGATGLTVSGGGGGDQLYAGAGNDLFVYGGHADSLSGRNDEIHGFTPGADRIDISAVDGGYVHLAYAGGDSYLYFDSDGAGGWRQVLRIDGAAVGGGDLIASSGATVVVQGEGLDGSHPLSGGPGDDQIFAGPGGGAITGGAGRDALRGGAGQDTFVYQGVADSPAAAYDVIFDFASGQDKLDVSAVPGEVGLAYDADGKSYVAFGDYAGQVVVNGLVKPSDLVAPGVVVVFGQATSGTLYGGGNTETRVFAGPAGDTLVAGDGAGPEAFRGGAGADRFVVPDAGASRTDNPLVVYDFQTGADKLDLSGVAGGMVTLTPQGGDVTEVLFGVAGAGEVLVHGAIAASDIMSGAAPAALEELALARHLPAHNGALGHVYLC